MTIDIAEVGELRAAWRNNGSPACGHPRVVEVSSQGLPTGATACMLCGYDGHGEDWDGKPKPEDDDGNSW